MKVETYNRLVTWHNDTRKALSGPRDVNLKTQEGIEYIIKLAELQTIRTIIKLLGESEFKDNEEID